MRILNTEYSLESPDLWLHQLIYYLQEANDEYGENSDYNGPDVSTDNMKIWDNFVTAQEIQTELSPRTLRLRGEQRRDRFFPETTTLLGSYGY